MLFEKAMKATVLQRSRITRYDGTFSSLSAFLMSPSPVPTDTETADVRGDGAITLQNDDFVLTYKEEESRVTVKVEKAGDTLTITRGGCLLTFRVGARTAFEYRTPYGTLPTEAYTEELLMQEKVSTRLVTLIYTAVFGGMAQKNEMRFKITL